VIVVLVEETDVLHYRDVVHEFSNNRQNLEAKLSR
jgi:hypothetical protein